ncbi:MAG: pyridoxamine 5'-phosphate oxidase family protein [Acidimicrobiales bacterium]
MQLADSDDIPEAQCWDLLRSVSIGRLALSIAALPTILPVQYFVEGDELAICLGHHTISERAVNDAIVAFSADSILANTTGWSVQAMGTSRMAGSRHERSDCGQPSGGQIVRLQPAVVSGQRVRLCPLAASALPPI